MQHYWNYPVKQKLYPLLQRIMRKKQIEYYLLHSDKGKNDRINIDHHHHHLFSGSFEYTVKKQGWMGGGTRSVKFTHGTTTLATVRSILIHTDQRDRNLLESNRSNKIT